MTVGPHCAHCEGGRKARRRRPRRCVGHRDETRARRACLEATTRRQARLVATNTLICANCGAENEERARFCGSCAAPLPAATPGRGEARKVVTILFSDVSGFTSLGEELDPESLRRLMGRYFAAIQEIVERHEGRVEKFIGDALMAVFGVPRAGKRIVSSQESPRSSVDGAAVLPCNFG